MAKKTKVIPDAPHSATEQDELIKIMATHVRVGDLLSDLADGRLIPRPEFQRRLVWTNKHKVAFVETVLLRLPFPEIYIATGELDTKTGRRRQMLVDGQQRTTTLYQYFTGDERLVYGRVDVKAYTDLDDAAKKAFLDYPVVVRNLGSISMDKVRLIYRRINSTNYALNNMENLYARYDGEFRQFCLELAESPFFSAHGVFSESDKKRMHDLSFAITLVISVLSGYPNRNEQHEEFLSNYNTSFSPKGKLQTELDRVFGFIDDCDFPSESRAWRQVDLLNLLVETHHSIFHENKQVSPSKGGAQLRSFFEEVSSLDQSTDRREPPANDVRGTKVFNYLKAATRASSDKYSRAIRGTIIADVLAPDSTRKGPARLRKTLRKG